MDSVVSVEHVLALEKSTPYNLVSAVKRQSPFYYQIKNHAAASLPKLLHCKDQLGRVSLLSGILFITLGLGSDGSPSMLQSRTPPSAITSLPDLPMSLSGYSYMLLKLGPLQFTRKVLLLSAVAVSWMLDFDWILFSKRRI